MALRIGELMVKNGLITMDQLAKAVEEQKRHGGKLGTILVRMGILEERELLEFLSRQFRIRAVELDHAQIQPELIKLIPSNLAKKLMILPIKREGATLTVAMCDPAQLSALDDIKFMTGYNIEPVLVKESSLVEALKRYYGGKGLEEKPESIEAKDYFHPETEAHEIAAYEHEEEEDSMLGLAEEDFQNLVNVAVDQVEVVEEPREEITAMEVDAPIVRLVNGILIKAVKLGVSDIHIEPYEKSFRVRYRIDGVLRKAMGLPLKIRNAVISRIKIMAQLDIAERRLPQDGRIKMKIGRTKEMDFRVSVVPTLWGEKVVLRLLDKSSLQLDMTKLGFEENQLKQFKAAIYRPYGMVLVTGPTGSGKTTTLYSALAELNKETDNIMTAEDPVEYNLPGINQVQMHEEIGLNFATALRAFLRQDPDIIMVGEIRDFETAEIAIKAALTGHLVLSTVHTNDAPSTVNRLLNMGIEPFLVASATNLILAQRLGRRICPKCKEEVKVPPQALLDVGVPEEDIPNIRLYKGRGCEYCLGTGYKGRIAFYEVMPVGEEIRELILVGASASEIKREAMRLGMMTLRQSAIMRMKEGITTIEEVIRCTAPD
jgi:type IV pilus assembly protein PilB